MAYSFSTTFPLDFRASTSEQQMRYKNELKKPYKRNHPKPTVLYVPQYVANFVSKKSCSI